MTDDKPEEESVAQRVYNLAAGIDRREGEQYAIFVFRGGEVGFMTSLTTAELAKQLKRFISHSKQKKVVDRKVQQPSLGKPQ